MAARRPPVEFFFWMGRGLKDPENVNFWMISMGVPHVLGDISLEMMRVAGLLEKRLSHVPDALLQPWKKLHCYHKRGRCSKKIGNNTDFF